MNIIRVLIIIGIILYIMDIITNGKVLQFIVNYINTSMDRTIDKNINNNIDEAFNELNKFISLIESDTYNIKNIILPTHKRQLANREFHGKILHFLNNILNTGNFIFSNIELLNHIYYYKVKDGKSIEMFKFSANVIFKKEYKKKILGDIIFSIDLFVNDSIKDTTRLKTIRKLYTSEIDDMDIKINTIKILGKNINESYYDDLFIKSNNENSTDEYNISENSLIPSIVNITQTISEEHNN